MTMGNGSSRAAKKSTNHSTFAPHPHAAYPGIAGGEDQSDDDGEAEYAQVQEIYPGADAGLGMGAEQQMYTFSQDATPNKGSKLRPPPPRGRMEKGAAGSKWSGTVVCC